MSGASSMICRFVCEREGRVGGLGEREGGRERGSDKASALRTQVLRQGGSVAGTRSASVPLESADER